MLRSLRTLHGEVALVTFLRRSVNFLEDQLADRHPSLQADDRRADVPDLQLNRIADKRGLPLGVAKTGVNGRGRDVNAEPEPCQGTLPLDASRQPRTVGK